MTGQHGLVNANDYASIVHTYEVIFSGVGTAPTSPPEGYFGGKRPGLNEMRGGCCCNLSIQRFVCKFSGNEQGAATFKRVRGGLLRAGLLYFHDRDLGDSYATGFGVMCGSADLGLFGGWPGDDGTSSGCGDDGTGNGSCKCRGPSLRSGSRRWDRQRQQQMQRQLQGSFASLRMTTVGGQQQRQRQRQQQQQR